jgi:hypothetical protein
MDNAPAHRDMTAEQTAALLDLLPSDNLHHFGNAQSFHPERRQLYFTLPGPKLNGASQAVIVRSDGTLLLYSFETITREGFYPSTIDPPSGWARWSRQNLQSFLDVPTPQHTAAQVYQEITGYLKRFIYHDDPRVLGVVALCIMGSYVHTIFATLPLLLFTGERGTGKTRIGEIMTALGFNGKLRSSLTSAALAREATRDQPLICIDEAEDLGNGGRHQETCRLLRAMYRNSGIREISGPGGTGLVFHLFCPVVLVNIVGVDDALRDRTIEVQTVQRKGSVERFFLPQQLHSLQRLRDHLYRFACAYVGQIYDSYTTYPQVDSFSDRTQELWQPLWSVARIIDTTDHTLELCDQMAKLAGELCQEKQEQEQFVARDMRIIAGLYFFLQNQDLLGKDKAEVEAAALTSFIRAAEAIPDLRMEEVARILGRSKLIDKKFRRRIADHGSSTNPLVHYALNVNGVKERAQTLGLLHQS